MSEDYVNTFWNQNIAQMWIDTEFPVAKDIAAWSALSPAEQTVYKRVLAGLTGLDTMQGTQGMPLISQHIADGRKQAVLSFMGAMEHIHTKSYSTIFTTLIPTAESRYLLEEWVAANPFLTKKTATISEVYRRLLRPDPRRVDVYLACVASVLLESFLFYSGFYYPLYLAGQGRMTTSGEVIRKILLDESIHGVFVGMIAQEIRAVLAPAEMAEAEAETERLVAELYANEVAYTREIYGGIGLAEDVVRYVEYNANKALMNLALPTRFSPGSFSAIVENGLATGTKHHDFFSQKGDGYVIALNIEPIRDEDFVFERV